MPLTIAHPAAVLLLPRTRLPLSALVVGSMAPDLEYLLRLAPTSTISHTPAGLAFFCVPAGLAVLWLFHRVWLPPLLVSDADGSGDTVARRPFAFGPPARLAIICAAILLGAITHVAWDSFTHRYGWMVRHWPLLAEPVGALPGGLSLPVFKVLQHGSTLLGLAVIAAVLFRARSRLHRPRAGALWTVVAITVAATLAAMAFGLHRTGFPTDPHSAARFLGSVFLAFFATAMILATIAGALWKPPHHSGRSPFSTSIRSSREPL